VFKKFFIIFFLSIFIFVFNRGVFASGDVVPGLTYEVPESPDYPNHTFIFIYERFMNDSGDGVFMVKYYMPIVLSDRSSSTIACLEIVFSNGLHYKYNPSNDEFEPVGGFPKDDRITSFFLNENREYCRHWYDDDVYYYGFKPLASNHNIYLDDGTLFFWTPQQNTNSPLLYRIHITEMMKTILTVGGKTLGIVLVAFGIVLGVSLVKSWIFSFLR